MSSIARAQGTDTPRSEQRASEGTSPAPHGGTQAPDALSDALVVVVDDDDSTREALVVFLTLHGANVLPAATAAEALEYFERTRPELLVSDIDLPGDNGYALIDRVRSHDDAHGRYTPAIAMSGLASCDTAPRARGAGFDVFLPKPIDMTALLSAVVALICR